MPKDQQKIATIISEVADNLGLDENMVDAVVADFALQLHRHALEYRGLNGDFIGEDLRYQVGPQAFYHLVGFLEYFAERYTWDPGSASEYLARVGSRRDWAPFRRQMEGWDPTRPPGEATQNAGAG